MYIYIYIYWSGVSGYTWLGGNKRLHSGVFPLPCFLYRGFQGYWLKDNVKGPQFEKTKTQLLSNHKLLEEYQTDS